MSQQPQDYEKVMQSADERFANGDYISAKTYYEMALRLKANDPVAQKKLNQSIEKIQEQMEKQSLFYNHLDSGDRLNKDGQLEAALASYQKALEIFPDDKYTNTQVNSILGILEKAEKRQSDFDRAMLNGQQLVDNEKYEEAIIQFQIAANLFPEEKLTQQKLSEAKQSLDAQIKKEQQFQQLKEDANAFLLRKNFAAAIEKMEAALQLFPADSPTLAQLNETRALKEKSEAYEQLLARADEAYQNQQLEQARTLYGEALGFWPQQAYPADMIKKINTYFESDDYLNSVALLKYLEEADQQFQSKDWANARDTYYKVLEIDVNHVLANERLTEITFFIQQNEESAQLETSFKQLVDEGDTNFKDEKYDLALAAYNQAAAIRQENELSNKIELTNQKLTEKKTLAKAQEQYQSFVNQAETQIQQNNYQAAKTTLTQAIALISENEIATTLLVKVDAKLKEIEDQKIAEADYNKLLQQAQLAFEASQWELAEEYYTQALQLKQDDAFIQARLAVIQQNKMDEAAYNENIENGNAALISGMLDEAQRNFEEAVKLKPNESLPKNKLNEINVLRNEIAASNEKELQYNQLIELADQQSIDENFVEALNNYQQASQLFPDRGYASGRIDETKNALQQAEAEQKQFEDYTRLIAEADQAVKTLDWQTALIKYQQATNLFENESYPRGQITIVENELKRLQEAEAIETAYQEKIREAELLFDQNQLSESLKAFEAAAAIKPIEEYPGQKISVINQIMQDQAAAEAQKKKIDLLITQLNTSKNAGDLEDALRIADEILQLEPNNATANAAKAEIEIQKAAIAKRNEEQYLQFMREGEGFIEQKSYQEAIISFKSALGFKKNDEVAQQRISQVEAILEERLLALRSAYNKLISEGDRHFNTESYDLAIEAYLKAENTKPDETYPREMMRKIATLMEANKMRELINSPETLSGNVSKQFAFEPIDVVDRRSNYILIKARNLSDNAFPLLVNFGSPTGRNGGFVLPIPANQEINDFIVRIGSQYKWFSEDNTWIELLPENGSIEVNVIQISKGK